MPYSFPIPYPRGFRPDFTESKCNNLDHSDLMSRVNDLVLHVLFARVSLDNNTHHEFQTIYDRETKMLEIDIPSCYLDFLEDIQVGPNIRRYLRWLVGVASGAISDNLVWVTMEQLTKIDVRTYRTPHDFFPESLAVFVNGVRVENTNDDGFDILDDNTFELKESYPANFRISAGYLKKHDD